VVQQGVPFEMAVLVNDTNLANVQWQPYTSSFTATLGPTDGDYTVRVTLRGRDLAFPPVWDDTEITLDRVAPVVTITNPVAANATVSKPYLQLLGHANEPLSALTGDLTNAAGTRSNLLVTVIGQDFDPEAFDFSTNYFQAFDVPLATNENFITLRATDRAGNLTVTNLTVFLDYSGATNPPVVQVTWPPAGARVSGDSFTVRGWTDDETAQIVAEVVDAAGVTNTVSGLVERNGTFWLEGLPLKPGTNTLWLTATSAAGQTTQSTLSVVQSDLALTVTSTPEGENLWDGTGWAGGTVGDASCSVSVNGVTATVDANGNWSAEAVPLYGEGMVTFAVVATRPGEPAVHRLVEKEKPAVIRVTKHFLKQVLTAPTYTDTWLKEFRQWPEDAGGVRRFRHVGKASRIVTSIYPDDDYNHITEYQWSDTNVAGTFVTTYASGGSVTGIITSPLVTSVPDRQVDHLESGPTWTHEYQVEHYYAKGVRHEWPGILGKTVETLSARTELTLFTGGRQEIGQETLFSLGATLTAYGKPQGVPWYYTPTTPVTEGVTILGRPLDDDGKLWCLVANNSKTIITPDLTATSGGTSHVAVRASDKTPWNKHYKFTVDVATYRPAIMANDAQLIPKSVQPEANFCVGQGIYFNIVGLPPGIKETVVKWSLPGIFANRQPDTNCLAYYDKDTALLTRSSATNGALTTYCWYVSGVREGTARARLWYKFSDNGGWFPDKVDGKFNVHRPSTTFIKPAPGHGTPTVMVISNAWLSLGWNASQDMSFGHQISPGGFSGQAGYTQLASGEYTHSPTGLPMGIATNGLALDTAEFYRGISSIAPNTTTTTVFFDGPKNGLHPATGSAKMDVEFKTYLLFKPDAGPGPNIFVPLGRVLWELHAQAANNVVFNDSNVENVVGPTPSDSTDFPHWNSVWTPPGL
jgi:hypothetical protein